VVVAASVVVTSPKTSGVGIVTDVGSTDDRTRSSPPPTAVASASGHAPGWAAQHPSLSSKSIPGAADPSRNCGG